MCSHYYPQRIKLITFYFIIDIIILVLWEIRFLSINLYKMKHLKSLKYYFKLHRLRRRLEQFTIK